MAVPDTWKAARLPEVADLEMGETIIAKDLTGDGIPVFSAARDVRPWGHTSASRKRYRRGTIVVGARGSIGYPRLPPFDEFVCTQTTIAVIPRPTVSPAYLRAALDGVDFDAITAKQAVPMLTIGALREVALSLPPLPEQRKIAAILTSVDETIEKTEAVIEQLQVVKKAMMEELLTRGMPGWHTRFKQTEIGEVPEGWDLQPGERLFELRGGYGPAELTLGSDGDALFLKVDDFNDDRNRRRLVASTLRFAPGLNPRIRTYGSGGLVFPKRGAAIFKNRVGILAATATVDPNLMVLLPGAALDPVFFMYALKQIGLSNLSDNSGIPQLNNKHLYPRAFAVPSIAEQLEIASILELIDDREIAETTQLHNVRALKDALSRALLSGDLRVTPDEAPQ